MPRRAHLALLLALAFAVAPGCGPWGPMGVLPGGPLVGPDAQRSAAEACDAETLLAALETRGSWLRHSITLFCFSHDGVVYLPSRNGGTKRWTRNAVASPQVRLEIAGAIHRGRLERVTELAPGAAAVFLRKVVGVEVDRAEFLLEPPAPDDDRTDLWMFRFEEESS